MRVLDPGHRYELLVLDGEEFAVQELQFVKRTGMRYPGNERAYPGTISQEVLRCLIDRAIYVNKQIRCWETRISIGLMHICVWLYERRAAKLHRRKAPKFVTWESVWGPMCVRCGHVGCTGKCLR